jgi:peptide/nickel transport system substrate-binding protein
MRKFAVVLVSAITVLACGTGGGGPVTANPSPKAGGTLKVAQESEITTLDPTKSRLLVEREIYYNLYDSLLTMDTKTNIQPGLATKWDTSDPKNISFTLRAGVKFHDGTDFDATAVKWNIERHLTDKDSQRKSELASVQSVEVKDPLNVVFHMKLVDGTLLAQLVDRAGMMMSPKAVQAAGAEFGSKPVGGGTGPFMFVEWKRDDHLTLAKNPNYWRKGLPYLDGITYYSKNDQNAMFASLKTGDIDFGRGFAAKDIDAIKADSNLVYKDIPSFAFLGIELNEARPPFNDIAKRKAVATAIDRAAILKNVNFNIGVVSYGPISPTSWAYDPNEKIFDKADPDKAKSLATGFSFTLKVGDTPDATQAGQLIQSQLAKAGITVQIESKKFNLLTQDTLSGNFEAAFVGWSGRLDPDGNMYQWFHTGGSNNDAKYSNPQVDKMLEDARTTVDQSKRKQLYQDAQKQLVGDAAYVFTTHGVAAQVSTKHVQNFTVYPDAINRFVDVWKN